LPLYIGIYHIGDRKHTVDNIIDVYFIDFINFFFPSKRNRKIIQISCGDWLVSIAPFFLWARYGPFAAIYRHLPYWRQTKHAVGNIIDVYFWFYYMFFFPPTCVLFFFLFFFFCKKKYYKKKKKTTWDHLLIITLSLVENWSLLRSAVW